MPSFTNSKDKLGSLTFKNWPHESDHANLREFFHHNTNTSYIAYLCTKLDDSSFSRFRDMIGPPNLHGSAVADKPARRAASRRTCCKQI